LKSVLNLQGRLAVSVYATLRIAHFLIGWLTGDSQSRPYKACPLLK